MMNYEFHSPWFLCLFLFFIPLLIRDFKKNKKANQGVLVPSTKGMQESNGVVWVIRFLKLTKYCVLSCLIIAIARPRSFSISHQTDDTRGMDIVLSVDISLSMLARDLNPDRLTALKEIAKKFVQQRENDRLGLVIYSGEAFMKAPLTTDHQVILDEITAMQPGDVNHGTAIGEGLAVAVKHLKDSKAKSKIIILMTDGVNTIPYAMPPDVAAELAKNNGIKVYTIGIGTNGVAEFPQFTPFGDVFFVEQEVKIDEAVLTSIADLTGGKYFRATSNDSLEKIYDEINRFEKSEIPSKKNYEYQEYFRIFLLIALGVLVIDALIRWNFFKILN